MSTTTLIGAALAAPNFGTTGVSRVSWVPTSGTNWTGTSTDHAFVSKAEFFTWGSAPDKNGEDPYKTMNTWYTTNKAAIDSASLASSTQVASWALYVDLTLQIASTSLLPPTSSTTATYITASAKCGQVTNTVITAAAVGTTNAAALSWGDNFSLGVVNSTTTARTPLLRWGNQVVTAATASPLANGTAGTVWKQYAWTSATIADYAAFSTTEISTLAGAAVADAAIAVGSASMGTEITTTGTELICDTTKWASATACDGVTRWGLGTISEYTSSTALGSRRAWLWLADANPTSAASVFGIEKSDVLNFTFYQHNVPKSVNADIATDACALEATSGDVRESARFNNWGVATFTYAGGASATLLGASAVMAALVSFF